jgi:hypothetical protein
MDTPFQQSQAKMNQANSALIRMNRGYQLRSRYRNKVAKFRRTSRHGLHLSSSALPQDAYAPTRNKNTPSTTGLASIPTDVFELPTPQSSLPSLQEVLSSMSASSGSLDLPPPQNALPSFDTVLKTSYPSPFGLERHDVIFSRERDCVVDVFPIRL